MADEQKWSAYIVLIAVHPTHNSPTIADMKWAIGQSGGVQDVVVEERTKVIKHDREW